MNQTHRAIAFGVVVIVGAALLYSFTASWRPSQRTETFSQFMSHVQGDEVKEVVFSGDEIAYATNRGTFRAIRPDGYEGLPNQLLERNVMVSATLARSVWTTWGALLVTSWGPVLLLMAFLLFFYPPTRPAEDSGSPVSFSGGPGGAGGSHEWM